ncbi:MAG: cytochrome c family protein [Deltaproteobacteria bacterium]|nr:cytochrome c family protein [Deltaproteobacteria bacterium]
MKKTVLAVTFALAAFLSTDAGLAARKPSYEGYKKCGGCHKSQKDSWLKTSHGDAFDMLKPKEKAKEKKKAKLDPDKDYTSDEKCVGCHTTGYKRLGGYSESVPENKAQYLINVGCEVCHGPGSLYRKEHSKAGNRYKKTNEKTPRQDIVDLGQDYDYEEACNSCHMNYKGSPWKGAKEPYTPFTPEVDPEYKFNFDKAVRETGKGKAMHEHFKLRNVFEGEPVPKLRDEFQKKAKEPAPAEEETEE